MLGFTDAEGFVQLGIEDPLAVLVGGLAVTGYLAAGGKVDFIGALVGLADLVVQAPLHIVGQQAAQGELMVDAEALAGHHVVAGAVAV
ncbi:hypothetical protein D3C80_1768410 [compost metagenome]